MEQRFRDPASALARSGLSARKGLSQNFLVDGVIARAILEALPREPGSIIEIGAGPGTMTRALGQTRSAVAAVEIDERLLPVLRRETGDIPTVSVVAGDAMKLPLAGLVPSPYAVFGNIPYHITGLLIPRLLDLQPAPDWVCVLVQREVAERLSAEPGGWSLATLAVRAAATVELLMRVPARAFDPAPKVDSALVLLRPGPRAAFADDAFFTFARAVFQERRKQLTNAVANAFDHDLARGRDVVARSGLEATRRPQTLDLEEWKRLYSAYQEVA
ncbi:MAG TPA: 16S rRNA (adenine(1518)-N(6)/adenine(1519)-N(6))-dimethyltransferase RsmA [Myxococcaceae bacterium]|nr:16S rRNA (adenine(1518)-N(6)/adenine(1519)-N(6))-dimethyltransferase RsmA [Myxococcaceae bacterium]